MISRQKGPKGSLKDLNAFLANPVERGPHVMAMVKIRDTSAGHVTALQSKRDKLVAEVHMLTETHCTHRYWLFCVFRGSDLLCAFCGLQLLAVL